MDIKNTDKARTKALEDIDNTVEFKPYNYAKEGIMTKTLPKILFKGNGLLVTFIQLLDMRMIMFFKNIDRLKRFKWITWYE